MNPPRTTAKQVFLDAIEQYAPDQWSSYLDQVCDHDSELRRRVEVLLGAHVADGSLLDNPAMAPAATIEHLVTEKPGTQIGPYKLLQQIGEGGFGVVFLAEQDRPVRRRVALKVIKPGMDTRQVVARFEAERQALAMMDHPNIAKVFDAGTTNVAGSLRETSPAGDSAVDPGYGTRSVPTTIGRPYFVMELVQGVPITQYCDQCNLTTRERLELFVTVCQAIQHAHQKGVIHRDIKPTNVLVAIQDGRPAPKIIDFGVAKAIDQRLTERTLTIAFAQMVGTPLYMSPEQAELSPLGVDTRSDIYSLGVLLYELLTGTTPFDKDRLHAASYDELRRIIREEEPPRPSARLSSLPLAGRAGEGETVREKAVDLTTIAEHRRTDARHLSQQVRGELDWIVMKCLEKDRNRRYETPNSLARDIERYLHDEPVQACPPSVGYRLNKFIRRNKVGVLAGSAVVLALFAGLALATAGFVQARREARISAAEAAKATAISDLLQTALQSANPDQAKGAVYTVRQLLDDFAGGLANQLVGQPEVEAQIRATIGNAYRRLGLYDLAAPQFETALALRRRIAGTDAAEYAEILMDYAQNLAEQTRPADAERTAREAVRIYRRAGVTGRPFIKALWILQLQLANRAGFATEKAAIQSAYAEEQVVVDEALAIAEANGTEYPELANMLHRHAPLLFEKGDEAGAEECGRRAVEMHRRMHGNDHPETAYGLGDLGRVLRDRKKYREAESAIREALEIFRRYHGDNYWLVQSFRDQLNQVIRAQDDAAGLDAQESKPQEPTNNAEQGAGSAAANRSVRLAQDALERELRNAIASFDKNIASAPDNQLKRLNQAATYRQVAEIDLKHGKIDEAIEYLRSAVVTASPLVAEDPNNPSYFEERARAQLSLAEALAHAQRIDESLAAFDVALDMNEDAAAKFVEEDWVRTLVIETGTRISSVLQMSDERTPEQVSQDYYLLRRAIEQFDHVNFGSDISKSHELARIYLRIGQRVSADSSWNDEAEAARQRALKLWESFVTLNPKDRLDREDLSWTLTDTVNGLQDGRDPETDQELLERLFLRAIALHSELAKESPDDPVGHPQEIGHLHRRLGWLFRDQGRLDEARQHFESALAFFEDLSKSNVPWVNGQTYRDVHADTLPYLSQVLIAANRSTEAVQACRRQISFYEQLQLEQPQQDVKSALTKTYLALAHSLAANGEISDAKQAVERAAEVSAVNAQAFNGFTWNIVSARDVDPAVAVVAVQVAEQATQAAPNDANILNTLGVAQYRAGNWSAAIDSLNKAKRLAPEKNFAFNGFFLAMAHSQLGHKDKARTWYEKGVEWTDKNQPANEELRRFRAEAAEQLGITEAQPSNESAEPNEKSPQ